MATTKAPYRRAFHPAIGPCLVPTSQDGLDQIDALKADKEVMVHLHAARNPKHHRMFFALLNKVIEGGAWDGDLESLMDAVKIEAGHVERTFGLDGRMFLRIKSINWESMPQDKFSRFFDRACFYISNRLLGSEDWEALRDDVVKIVDGDLGARANEHAERYG